MREYLRSPYVIIGVIGIVYYLYKRNILVNKIVFVKLVLI